MQDEAGVSWLVAACFLTVVKVHKGKKGKVHPCTGIEALYRPYGP